MSRRLLTSASLIIFWYACNISVILSNKYLLANYGFKYPVFLTGCHMLACTVWGNLASKLNVVSEQRLQSRWQLAKISVLAAVFCLTIVFGNVSLRYIPVSFNQAIGATTPFFTALMSFLVNRTPESKVVYASLVPVVLGIIIATGGEPLFNLLGFVAALSATGGRAFKSVLQGLLLTDKSEKMDSMNLLRHMAPIAGILLLPVIAVTETGVLGIAHSRASRNKWFVPALVTNATLAFLANLANFVITKHTSALTLQVLGNAKGVAAAVISILIFKNPVTLQGALGYAIALFGVALYSHAKNVSKQAAAMDLSSGSQESLLPFARQDSGKEQQPVEDHLRQPSPAVAILQTPFRRSSPVQY